MVALLGVLAGCIMHCRVRSLPAIRHPVLDLPVRPRWLYEGGAIGSYRRAFRPGLTANVRVAHLPASHTL